MSVFRACCVCTEQTNFRWLAICLDQCKQSVPPSGESVDKQRQKKGDSICITGECQHSHFHLFSWTLKLNPEQIGNKISVGIDRVQLATGSCASNAKKIINSFLDEKWNLILNLFQNKLIKCFRYSVVAHNT